MAPPHPGVIPINAPITGCIAVLFRIVSTNFPAVIYCNQLNNKTMAATKTVTARNASRILITIISIISLELTIKFTP